MLQSMTGYGDAQLEAHGISFLVEIRSFNNRFLKTSIKLPDALLFAEPHVDRLIRKELARGSVSYTLHLRYLAEQGPFEVNHPAMQGYISHLEQIQNLHSPKMPFTIDLAALLQLPGVCQLRKYDEQEHKIFIETTEKLTKMALIRLKEMRAEEGNSLLQDLQQNCSAIDEHLQALQGLTGTVVDNYRRRVQERINSMLAEANLKLEEDALIKEVAFFAERCDIHEEVLRLQSHLAQFNQACLSADQAGRRLEFLTQEMLREANTIASKANDASISQHVVEIKVAIDRLKEQVQNVE